MKRGGRIDWLNVVAWLLAASVTMMAWSLILLVVGCADAGFGSPAALTQTHTDMVLSSPEHADTWHEAADLWIAAGHEVILIDGECDPAEWGCAGDVAFLPNGEAGGGRRQWPEANAAVNRLVPDSWRLAITCHALGHAIGLGHEAGAGIMGTYTEETRP